MRRTIESVFALAVIAASLSLIAPASACISYNRDAELKTVDDAIAAKNTKPNTREKLVALRADMVATDRTAIENSARYSKAATEAFKLMGKPRIRTTYDTRAGAPIPRGAPSPQGAGFIGCG